METLEKRQLKDLQKFKLFRLPDFSIRFKYPLLIVAFAAALLVFSSNEAEQEPKHEQADTVETFNEFVERVLMERSTKRETYFLGNVSKKMQKMLKDSVQMNFEGFKWIIGDNDILHIEKNHGKYKSERSRGQINITVKDFQKIYSIINSPDNIELSINEKNSKKYLTLSKYLNKQKHTYVVLISIKKWRLTGKTMYIKKAPTIKPMPF